MKKNLLVIVLSIFALSANVFSRTPYEKFLQKTLKIKHVFPIPSTAYGPGTVLLLTQEGAYMRRVWAWDACGVESEEKWVGLIKKSPAVTAKMSGSSEFRIQLTAEEIKKIKAEASFSRITSCKIELKNGMQHDVLTNILDIYNNITTDPKLRGEIELGLRQNPYSKVFLELVAYSYDMEFSANTDQGWKVAAEIPENVLKILTAKIGIDFNIKEQVSMSGGGVYVGFNGDPMTSIFRNIGIGMTITIDDEALREKMNREKTMVMDITDIFKKK